MSDLCTRGTMPEFWVWFHDGGAIPLLVTLAGYGLYCLIRKGRA